MTNTDTPWKELSLDDEAKMKALIASMSDYTRAKARLIACFMALERDKTIDARVKADLFNQCSNRFRLECIMVAADKITEQVEEFQKAHPNTKFNAAEILGTAVRVWFIESLEELERIEVPLANAFRALMPDEFTRK